MGAVSAAFWGLLILSVLVTVHEAGHFLAARACGMRVTEFYLGMPSRFHLAKKSKKYGTEFGVTPLLLGGYTRICGMENSGDKHLSEVFAYVQKQGRTDSAQIADALAIDEEEVEANLNILFDWATLRACGMLEQGEKSVLVASTLARDPQMLTEYDRGHNFELKGSTAEGEARPLVDAKAALEFERARTYDGKGFFKRFFCLIAGPAVNIVLAFLVVVGVSMTTGFEVASGTNEIGGVTSDSLAQKAGLKAGDKITAIDDIAVQNWPEIVDALGKEFKNPQPFELSYERAGKQQKTTIDLPRDGSVKLIGIAAKTVHIYPNFFEASHMAWSYVQIIADSAARLIMPQHTVEVLSQSSSVVGISVMASEAAHSGIHSLLMFAALISMSLGFMNLLPIPPLDGGKILIEIIQAIIKRPLSLKAKAILSYIGLALLLALFVFAVGNDVFHFIIH